MTDLDAIPFHHPDEPAPTLSEAHDHDNVWLCSACDAVAVQHDYGEHEAARRVAVVAAALGPHPQDPELRAGRATAILGSLPEGWRLVGPEDYSGHRTKDAHDCFAMNCHRLGEEVESLRKQLGACLDRCHPAECGCVECVGP